MFSPPAASSSLERLGLRDGPKGQLYRFRFACEPDNLRGSTGRSFIYELGPGRLLHDTRCVISLFFNDKMVSRRRCADQRASPPPSFWKKLKLTRPPSLARAVSATAGIVRDFRSVVRTRD